MQRCCLGLLKMIHPGVMGQGQKRQLSLCPPNLAPPWCASLCSVVQRHPGNVRLIHVIRVDEAMNTMQWETRSLGSRGENEEKKERCTFRSSDLNRCFMWKIWLFSSQRQHQRSEDHRTQFDFFNMIPVSNLPEQISWLLVEKTEVANAYDSEAVSSPQICKVWPVSFIFYFNFWVWCHWKSRPVI